ncbi:MAG: hypothetical protein SPH68_06580 [Candidatus Borkfalkiaceae bacterium]|nr:hypothetical protein [Clostridia bacterium]MDY6223803.1 hypothetical protein [Christensenellaceae bacterium]
MLEFLPQPIKEGLARAGTENVYEIRIRKNSPVSVNVKGRYYYLSERGATNRAEEAIVCTENEIENALYGAGRFSVYSVEEQLRRGFVTAEGGVRVGIAGEYVFENGKVSALKRASSLCVRVPHRIEGAGAEVFARTLKNGLKNVLIVSAPGRGKTTILRDVAERLTEENGRNVLICDERGEIAVCGALCGADVLSFVDKKQAFSMAMRALRPDVIVTDELSEGDCDDVIRAIRGGVYVVASAHFNGVRELTVPFRGVFDAYVALSERGAGNVAGIYDKNLRLLP